MTDYPAELAFQINAVHLPAPEREYRFHETRRWRFDLAMQQYQFKLAVEIDGGGFVNGRHSRGKGIEADCEKFAEAAILGWVVLRVTPRQVKNGQALTWIERWWGAR